jgi:hypothetical protein
VDMLAHPSKKVCYFSFTRFFYLFFVLFRDFRCFSRVFTRLEYLRIYENTGGIGMLAHPSVILIFGHFLLIFRSFRDFRHFPTRFNVLRCPGNIWKHTGVMGMLPSLRKVCYFNFTQFLYLFFVLFRDFRHF